MATDGTMIRPATRTALAMLILASGWLQGGCTRGIPSGNLRTVSMTNDPVELQGTFVASYFSHDGIAGTSFMLASVDPEQLMKGDLRDGQILHIELLWPPKAGYTPMDATATNASIRYVIISNGEMGIYGGAGFAWPEGDATDRTLRVSLEDASLHLQEKTAGFHDLLGTAQVTGSFNSVRDDKKTRQLNYAACQMVTNALGKSRYVFYENPTPADEQFLAAR